MLFRGSRVECVAWLALGLGLRREMGFCLRVLFMGFLPRNTVAVTIVCILVVLCNEHTFSILCNSRDSDGGRGVLCLYLAHAAADFVKCASYCLMILFLQISLY
jgi:hypothetical protein